MGPSSLDAFVARRTMDCILPRRTNRTLAACYSARNWWRSSRVWHRLALSIISSAIARKGCHFAYVLSGHAEKCTKQTKGANWVLWAKHDKRTGLKKYQNPYDGTFWLQKKDGIFILDTCLKDTLPQPTTAAPTLLDPGFGR